MSSFQKKSFITGIILILIGIILGAFGAHGLENKISVEKIASYETGVKYQIYHGFGFLFLGILSPILKKEFKAIFILMLLGVLFFSGSIYVLATQEIFHLNISKIVGPITPIGGLLLIISWLLLLIQLIKQK